MGTDALATYEFAFDSNLLIFYSHGKQRNTTCHRFFKLKRNAQDS